jgi:hypothetical protein
MLGKQLIGIPHGLLLARVTHILRKGTQAPARDRPQLDNDPLDLGYVPLPHRPSQAP